MTLINRFLQFKLGFLAILIIIFDQVLKLIVIKNSFYTLNTGFSLGFFQGNNFLAFALTTFLLVGIVFVYIKYKLSEIVNTLLVIIFSAGFSNLLDRLIYHGVIDYIQILNLPAFNLADILVTSSFVLIIILTFYGRENFKSRAGR